MPVAHRLALFYAASFLLFGVQLPFWPLFLAGRGLDAEAIGLVLAAGQWIKVVANPLAGIAADHSRDRRRIMVLLAFGTLGGLLLFLPAEGLWQILLVTVLTTAAASALLPLGETIALASAYALKLDYGRLRLWGSASFIAAALGGGALLAGRTSEIVLLLMIGAAALTILACLQLPAHPVAHGRMTYRGWRDLLFDRRNLLLLATATAIQTSHSVYYAFGTLYWSGLGYSGATIGWLWAEGVIAEIALFACGAPLVARLGPARLLLLAGAAGALRWGLTAGAVSLPALILLQPLHALSFGAAHLGAMHFMARALPPAWAASGQSLYAAVVAGIGSGLVMLASGRLYAMLGPDAYLVMAGLAALGAGGGWWLGRLWHGELLAQRGMAPATES